jgi:hypothetical protein
MTHPDEECNKAQAKFLAECPPNDRRFHELMFIVGNATYRYHQEAKKFEPSVEDWSVWIEGLKEPIKKEMQRKGFEESKSILSFTRYVMEKNDVGLEEYLKQSLSPKDFEDYQSIVLEKPPVE